MGMRGVVICSFGDRDAWIESIVPNVRQYWSGDVVLRTDRRRNVDCFQDIFLAHELQWLDHPRWPIRNTNVHLAHLALSSQYDSVCCLNDDMRIVRDFTDGFDLAERFGVCVPMNPRVYVKYNAMGADGGAFLGPGHGPACNVSPMFVCRNHPNAKILIEAYLRELQATMRGTLAFWNASWKTGIAPVYLPEQWCVSGSNAAYIKSYRKTLQGMEYSIEPIMLHWSQAGVQEAFKDVE